MDSEGLAHLVGVICDVRNSHMSRWSFPSKVGGMPAWLIPKELPEMKCEVCKREMTFLLQIYAPSAEISHAFHRTLMIFTCLHCRCFLRALRVQLPLVNEFYGTVCLTLNQIPDFDAELSSVCCDSCGMKKHAGSLCRALPEYGLEIEELDEIDLVDDEEDDDDEDMISEGEEDLGTKPPCGLDESETEVFDDFADTSIEKDKTFRIFKKFIEEAPSGHVVYYSIGGHPLWITDENQMPGSPPNCEHCGGARQFEFQIQPQLIYHLMKRLGGYPMNAAPFEWGVAAIYTCVANCGHEKYMEEFIYNQLEPAEWLDFNARKKIDFTKPSRRTCVPKITENESDGEWQ